MGRQKETPILTSTHARATHPPEAERLANDDLSSLHLCVPRPVQKRLPAERHGLGVPHLKHECLLAKTFALQPGQVQSPGRTSPPML